MSSDPTKTGVKYIGNDTPFVDTHYGSGLKFMPDQTRLVEPELAAKLTRHAEFVDDDTFDYVTATTNLTGGIENCLGVPFKHQRFYSGIPFAILFGDGGTNGLAFTGGGGGEFTLSAAVATGLVIPNGYMFIPANAGGSGCAAGMYYFTMSSSTAGVVYGNVYATGSVSIPESPIAFPGSPSGRITQTLAEVTVASFTLPASSLGKSGVLEMAYKLSGSASGGTKTVQTRLGSTVVQSFGCTTQPDVDIVCTLTNTGREDKHVRTRNNMSASLVSTFSTAQIGTLDTAAELVCAISLIISSNAADSIVLWVGAVASTYRS